MQNDEQLTFMYMLTHNLYYAVLELGLRMTNCLRVT